MPQPLSTDEIRKRWVAFFVAKDHKQLPSDSLVPQNDPSLLFTGAGMNQFKEHFLARARIDWPRQRAVTVQKCLRTGDIDNVGRTPSHHTFFEMLGNFSFGDYFKQEAIQWAWEFLLDPQRGLGLEAQRLSVTIFGGDALLGIEMDSAAEHCWRTFAPELQNPDGSWRIYHYGEHDNFWPASAPSSGPNGPCGPCSEVYYDTRPEAGAPEPVAQSRDPLRYVEIWNLVFTQYNRVDVGQLQSLSQTNIDTGAGLERVARVLQRKSTNFEIDLLFPIVQTVARRAGKPYGQDPDDSRRMRRITDHTRAAVFCIAEGVAPKNEGRNYVVRRLLRRALLDGRELGISDSFLGEVAQVVIAQMSQGYPDLIPRAQSIRRLIEEEEAAFGRTLQQGRAQFEEIVAQLRPQGQHVIAGPDAFRLWDTFGFPLELTTELAQTAGLSVDQAGFESAYQEAIRRSQAASGMRQEIFASGPVAELKQRYAGQSTAFSGYEQLRTEGVRVLALIQDEKLVETARPGEALVLLERTPFYAESGGQLGDRGWLESGAGRHSVLDAQRQDGLILHQVKLSAPLTAGALVTAEVAPAHRLPVIRNHSATHLLHQVLRAILGSHVEQRGSLVAPDRLRFDFTHFEPIGPEQLAEIERRVNEFIVADLPVQTAQLPLAQARARGAMALFGEKYGDQVRVVEMGQSLELCGGTHCRSTGQIGYFRITGESSIAAGVRRLEALTGPAAVADARRADELLNQAATRLKTRKETLLERIEALQAERTTLERERESLRRQAAAAAAGGLLQQTKEVAGTQLLAALLEEADAGALRTALDGIRKSFKRGAVVLGGTHQGKAALLVSFTPELVQRGAHAGHLLKALAAKVGGKGGGKPEMAQGGGPDPARLPEALAEAETLLAQALQS